MTMCKNVKTVTWESEALMGTPKESRWARLCPRAALSHAGLFVALMLYTAGGGLNHIDYKKYLDILKNEFEQKYKKATFFEKKIEDYDIIKGLGSGAYGEVFLVRDQNTFTYHALKAVEKKVVVERKHQKHLILEKKILESIQFPFAITLDAAFKDNVYLYFVLPFIPGGEMFTYIQKYGCFSDELSRFYGAQVTLALEYLHHCNVIHRDLKPENILIDRTGYIKLIDYGFCKVVKKKTWTLCGTPEYLAPEVIMSKGYSFAVDWWALGVLMFEMTCGQPPFYSSDPNNLYKKILDGVYKPPDSMNNECRLIVRSLLQTDPVKRLGSLSGGVYDIKSHVYFKQITWEAVVHQKMDPPLKPIVPFAGDTSNFAETELQKLKRCTRCLFAKDFEEF